MPPTRKPPLPRQTRRRPDGPWQQASAAFGRRCIPPDCVVFPVAQVHGRLHLATPPPVPVRCGVHHGRLRYAGLTVESPQGQDTPGPSVPGRSRLIAGGGIAALAVLLLGGALERVLIGTDPDATARAVREINTHVARVDGALTRVARELAGRVEVQDGLTGDRPAVRTVFDLLRATDGDQPFSDLAITLYDARLVPRAG
jgi:hypothetical protein